MPNCFITSNCASTSIYQHFDRPYDMPLAGSLFMRDEHFVNFCKGFDKYIQYPVTFTEGTERYVHPDISTDYPIQCLDHIEIHWIHEHSPTTVHDKWTRRVERYNTTKPTPLFLWSEGAMMNDSYAVIDTFLQIPNAYFISGTTTPRSEREIPFEGWCQYHKVKERKKDGVKSYYNLNTDRLNMIYIIERLN